ncbi:MAG: hypothetical protein QOK04_846 [Solirubrobacteraceae bacterium]|nr:hypothetical protein [Solirubrobacteraceae bacterium]
MIARRFNGPPDSAQGGYACGLVAERIGGTASVSLRRPPPLERPLDVRRGENGSVALLDGGEVVADGAAAELELDLPEPVALDEARQAAGNSPWIDRHPFPSCFGCGPERSQDEAIAVIMGDVEGRAVDASVWTPQRDFADAGGAVTPLFMWAALDCPTSSRACLDATAPCVLGRLTARLLAPARAGEPHSVTSWLIGRDGRKRYGGAAIHTADGECCGYSEGLWIELRDASVVGARVQT